MAMWSQSGSQMPQPVRGLALAMVTLAVLAAPAFCLQPPSDWRVIVLKGAEMPQLLGASENHLEVLALHQGSLEPIPFQIDEVRLDGSYALPDGSQPVSDDSPGILDRDDEIAMMFSDLSERANRHDRLPIGTLEISALDPLSGVRRYAYIAVVPSPRLSPVSYMSYDATLGRIAGAGYRMTFRGDFPIGLALKNASAKWSPNLIEGTEVRVTARVLMFLHDALRSRRCTQSGSRLARRTDPGDSPRKPFRQIDVRYQLAKGC